MTIFSSLALSVTVSHRQQLSASVRRCRALLGTAGHCGRQCKPVFLTLHSLYMIQRSSFTPYAVHRAGCNFYFAMHLQFLLCNALAMRAAMHLQHKYQYAKVLAQAPRCSTMHKFFSFALVQHTGLHCIQHNKRTLMQPKLQIAFKKG